MNDHGPCSIKYTFLGISVLILGHAMASAPRPVPNHDEMMQDVLFPDDGMPRGGKRKAKLSKDDYRRLEGKAYSAFELSQARPVKAKASTAPVVRITQYPGNTAKLSTTQGAVSDVTQVLVRSSTDPNFKPKHFLQRGFGLGERMDILKCFGANGDCASGPGAYDVEVVGQMRWSKKAGDSHPAQMACTNHKSCKLASFGKAAKFQGTKAPPPLAQFPGPGHYGKPDLWDPNWQRYPSLGKSFVRKLPPPGESRFGGLARQELGNAKGELNFIQ